MIQPKSPWRFCTIRRRQKGEPSPLKLITIFPARSLRINGSAIHGMPRILMNRIKGPGYPPVELDVKHLVCVYLKGEEVIVWVMLIPRETSIPVTGKRTFEDPPKRNLPRKNNRSNAKEKRN